MSAAGCLHGDALPGPGSTGPGCGSVQQRGVELPGQVGHAGTRPVTVRGAVSRHARSALHPGARSGPCGLVLSQGLWLGSPVLQRPSPSPVAG